MKKIKTLILIALVTIMTFGPIAGAGAYTIERDIIGNGYPAGYTSSNNYIILHEAGNPNNVGPNSLDNEVAFMKRSWNTTAFVSHFVGSGGRVKQLANPGAYQYGAGTYANSRSYAQIELSRTNNKATFEKDYKTYVNLARNLANQAGISVTLDGAGNGIKSHKWISDNFWGNHQDPYGYLAQWGISKAQLQKDLRTGIGANQKPDVDKETPTPGKEAPKPDSKGYQSKNGSYTFQHTTKIRNGVGTGAGYTGINYNPGQTVNYDRIYKNVNGYDWLSYVSYGGQRRYVAMTNGSGQSSSSSSKSYQSTSGTYTFRSTTRIRSGVGTSAGYTGLNYGPGQTVAYDRIYKNVNGYDWLSYISYGGQRRYVAMTNSGGGQSASTQQNQSGAYTFRNTTKIRNGVGVNAAYTGRNYNAGQTVYYDRIHRNVNGYDWLSYVSYNGQRHYVAMTN
ncbi:SH3 domain-containing protein [Tetragenococcus halophilus]|uniref:SH3 domain-containing protein n=1 Tax=Tetragenococcus halophilus TaxID=51669 RepID=UPI00336D253C|nr:SH3 domain-containing protein [Tetragenococcus halophilus]